jgi:hypothetical protein
MVGFVSLQNVVGVVDSTKKLEFPMRVVAFVSEVVFSHARLTRILGVGFMNFSRGFGGVLESGMVSGNIWHESTTRGTVCDEADKVAADEDAGVLATASFQARQ